MQIKTVTVLSGQNTSNSSQTAEFDRIHAPQYVTALYVPTIDAAIVFLQGSVDNVSFSRLLKQDGTGDWNIAISTGDRWMFLDQVAPFPYLKIELSANQTADRVFKFVNDVIQ